jgi:hypothetical protein
MKRNPLPRAWLSTLATLAAVGAAAGCDPFPDDSTLGEKGRIEFAYASQCFLDCSLDHPMAVGSTELITIDGAESYAFSSSNVKIATFVKKQVSCGCERSSGNSADGYGPVDIDGQCADGYQKTCDTYIEARGLGDGDVELVVRDDAGELVDQVRVQVRAAKSATFSRYTGNEWTETPSISGQPGQQLPVGAVFRDVEGRALLTSKGVSWTSDDGDIVEVEHQDALLNWSRGNQARATFHGEGETRIRAKLGDLETELPVSVAK